MLSIDCKNKESAKQTLRAERVHEVIISLRVSAHPARSAFYSIGRNFLLNKKGSGPERPDP